MLRIVRVVTLLLLVILSSNTGRAQTAAPLQVSLDCDECNTTQLRQDLTFVNYVRDRHESDVHILTTSVETSTGGERISLILLGQGQLQPLTDTFTVAVEEWESDQTVHQKLGQYIQAGLMRYLAYKNDLASITLSCQRIVKDTDATVDTLKEDAWDHWNFRLSGNGWFNGEKSYSSFNTWSSAVAYRTTADSKYRIGFYNDYNESNFEFQDASTFKSLSRGNSVSGSAIFSLADRWSGGLFGEYSTSTYYNTRRAINGGPAIEYSFFPYEESGHHRLVARYRLYLYSLQYLEETIFDRLEETRFGQSVDLRFVNRKAWGTIEMNVDVFSYLHDLTKTRATLWTNLGLNLVNGLSLDLNGSIRYANDQIYLPKQGATEEEILLRRKQLKTNYTYWSSVGLSYTFGSSDNSIVNSRFD